MAKLRWRGPATVIMREPGPTGPNSDIYWLGHGTVLLSDGRLWTRVHNMPRRKLYVPTLSENVPVHLFKPERTTDIRREPPHPEHLRIRDEWKVPQGIEGFTTCGLVPRHLSWTQTGFPNPTNLGPQWTPNKMTMVRSQRSLWIMMNYLTKLLWDHHLQQLLPPVHNLQLHHTCTLPQQHQLMQNYLNNHQLPKCHGA